jgi:hypothetical protein
MACEHARHDEQEIGKAVEVLERLGRDLLDSRKRPGASLGAAADRAREVTGRGGRAAPGRMNSLSGGSPSLNASSECSSASTCEGSIARWPGMQSSPPRSKSSCCTRVSTSVTASGSPGTASITPIALFASSTQP